MRRSHGETSPWTPSTVIEPEKRLANHYLPLGFKNGPFLFLFFFWGGGYFWFLKFLRKNRPILKTFKNNLYIFGNLGFNKTYTMLCPVRYTSRYIITCNIDRQRKHRPRKRNSRVHLPYGSKYLLRRHLTS